MKGINVVKKSLTIVLLVVLLLICCIPLLGCANYYEIDAFASDNHGSVYGGGKYVEGQTVVITAIPDDGYEFDCWSDGFTKSVRIEQVNNNCVYSATFKQKLVNYSIDTFELWAERLDNYQSTTVKLNNVKIYNGDNQESSNLISKLGTFGTGGMNLELLGAYTDSTPEKFSENSSLTFNTRNNSLNNYTQNQAIDLTIVLDIEYIDNGTTHILSYPQLLHFNLNSNNLTYASTVAGISGDAGNFVIKMKINFVEI